MEDLRDAREPGTVGPGDPTASGWRPLDPPYKMAAASAEGTGRRGWGEGTRRAPGLGRPVRGDGDQGHRARSGRSGVMELRDTGPGAVGPGWRGPGGHSSAGSGFQSPSP